MALAPFSKTLNRQQLRAARRLRRAKAGKPHQVTRLARARKPVTLFPPA